MKRRAQVYSPYWTLMEAEAGGRQTLVVQKVIERGDAFDDSRHASGNYYLTYRSAKARADAIRRQSRKGKDREYSKKILLCDRKKGWQETARQAKKR